MNNSGCPGPSSKEAGDSSACAGCPNQTICSTSKQVDLSKINANLKNVQMKLLVLSGKGGVGKSTVASNLAWALSSLVDSDVGLLDLDITGPSIPKMMGVEEETVHSSNSGWSPVWVSDNLACMSIGFLSDPDSAILWRGPKKNGLIQEFLSNVEWDVEYLIIDTPPGTSDEHLSIVTYLKESGISGAILVSTSSPSSILDVSREIKFCHKVGIPILGIIENMSIYKCKCGEEYKIFPESKKTVLDLSREFKIPFLGSIPLDPNLGKASDFGKNFRLEFPNSTISSSYSRIISEIINPK